MKFAPRSVASSAQFSTVTRLRPRGARPSKRYCSRTSVFNEFLRQRKTENRADSLPCGSTLRSIESTKEEETMTEVEKCEPTNRDLEAKRAACVQRGTELADERANVALAAHTGDAKAAKRLAELHTAIATHASELASFDAAIKAAGERLRAAEAAEARKHAGRSARELLKRADGLVQLAQSLDDANTVRVESSNALAEQLTQICALGANLGVFVPSHEQLFSLGSRADTTATMRTPWAREVGDHLPSNQRRT